MPAGCNPGWTSEQKECYLIHRAASGGGPRDPRKRPVRIPLDGIKKRKNRRETESSSVVYWPCREGDRVKEQILAVQRMQDYIDQHLFETVTLAELARQPCFPRGTRTGSLKPVPGYPPPIISASCGFPNQRCGSGMKP